MKKIFLILIAAVFVTVTACSPSMIDDDPAAQNCEANGGKVEIRNVNGESKAFCVFPDGTECAEEDYYNGECNQPQSNEDDEEESSTIANPASVYCEEQGGTLELRTDEEGGVTGYCIFDDGSECEEWSFYNGDCAPESEAIMKSPPQDASLGKAFVDGSKLLLEKELSVQITGNLPDPCHNLYVEIADPDDENNIHITTSSWQSNTGLMCVQVLEPFDVTVKIPTEGLADGVYTVFVNNQEVGSFQSVN
ncbi:MAG: DUF333 domain-containing protein [Anaerolineae bacterium]|jgi:putative hemolysin|nr:DUF333 domain-containing protein [Anaerolineae bacterium]